MSASEDIAQIRIGLVGHHDDEVCGCRSDALAALDRLEQRVDAGEPLFCDECGRDLQNIGHDRDCASLLEQRVAPKVERYDNGESPADDPECGTDIGPFERVRQKPDVVEAGDALRALDALLNLCSGWFGGVWPPEIERDPRFVFACKVNADPRPLSTTPPEAAPVPGSPDLASLVSSLTRERDEARADLKEKTERYERVLKTVGIAYQEAVTELDVYRTVVEAAHTLVHNEDGPTLDDIVALQGALLAAAVVVGQPGESPGGGEQA